MLPQDGQCDQTASFYLCPTFPVANGTWPCKTFANPLQLSLDCIKPFLASSPLTADPREVVRASPVTGMPGLVWLCSGNTPVEMGKQDVLKIAIGRPSPSMEQWLLPLL